MKISNFIARLMLVPLMPIAVAGYAQSGAATASALPTMASTSVSASAPASTKAIRAASRRLCKSVRLALSKAKGLDSQNIVTACRSGNLVLEGAVPEQQQIGIAVNAAQSVEGVMSVRNSLAVRPIGN